MRWRKPLTVAVAVAAAVLVAVPALAASGAAGANGTRTWKVTIENLTPPGPGAPGSQPLSPPLLVVHTNAVDVWSAGERASAGVAAIAEDADNVPLTDALSGLPGVHSVFTGAGGPIPSGSSASYTVRTSGRFNRLTLLTMLVNTNDAFTGLDGLHLDDARMVRRTVSWDAGSERNNELEAFIPGPCCNNPFVRDLEHRRIRPHRGITGVGDLDPALYDWPEPVARITIERLS
ncbi:MAG: spondin domain-containing protein [Sporichthyaceae bacterium]|nr:spondin domain-containing protein [Sporichthyaceae bacterium]